MTDAVLVINVGSSSVKAAIVSLAEEGRRIWSGRAEGIGQGDASLSFNSADEQTNSLHSLDIPDHGAAVACVLDAALMVPAARTLAGVGHRIVHGGPNFTQPTIIDEVVAGQLQALVPLAPLHMPQTLKGFAVARERLPDLPHVACFDTMFHVTLPRLAQLIALPRRLTTGGVKRYGFHGLSYESVLNALSRRGADVSQERIIVAHLGAGASMCAVLNGICVDTTMGFSTLSGLPMGTRCGDIDPGVLTYLLNERKVDPSTLQQLLYEESGLFALSGGTADMRQLLARRGDPEADEAVRFFCHQARRQFAALTASLGGVDRLVFTGGVGANAPSIREEICEGMDYLGVRLDARQNLAGEITISPEASPVIVQAFDTDEEQSIAQHVRRVLGLVRS